MYFVAVLLPEALNEKILVYKKQMAKNYGCTVGLKSPAHITLVPPFWTAATNEDLLRAELDGLAATLSPFTVFTANFSAFAPRTLFVAVKESADLLALKKKTDERFDAKAYGTKKNSRPFHPHITVATRDLQKKDFADAWPQFEKQKFEESFDVAALCLLRHNGRLWDVVHIASFAPANGDD